MNEAGEETVGVEEPVISRWQNPSNFEIKEVSS